MKIFKNLDPKLNRLPADVSRIVRAKPAKIPPFVDPNFFISNNPRVKANLAQFKNIDPTKIRRTLQARLSESVNTVNQHIQGSILFKGITFAVDSDSGRSFAVVINKETGEVLKKIPGDEFLSRSARLKDAAGLFEDITI